MLVGRPDAAPKSRAPMAPLQATPLLFLPSFARFARVRSIAHRRSPHETIHCSMRRLERAHECCIDH
jgi:hypothetical protein